MIDKMIESEAIPAFNDQSILTNQLASICLLTAALGPEWTSGVIVTYPRLYPAYLIN